MIPLIPTDYPFGFKRLQFPLKLYFVMTISKFQGQAFKFAGIDLIEDCLFMVNFTFVFLG